MTTTPAASSASLSSARRALESYAARHQRHIDRVAREMPNASSAERRRAVDAAMKEETAAIRGVDDAAKLRTAVAGAPEAGR